MSLVINYKSDYMGFSLVYHVLICFQEAKKVMIWQLFVKILTRSFTIDASLLHPQTFSLRFGLYFPAWSSFTTLTRMPVLQKHEENERNLFHSYALAEKVKLPNTKNLDDDSRCLNNVVTDMVCVRTIRRHCLPYSL